MNKCYHLFGVFIRNLTIITDFTIICRFSALVVGKSFAFSLQLCVWIIDAINFCVRVCVAFARSLM